MMPRGISRPVLAAAALAFALASVDGVNAQGPPRSEFEIKAAYLYTFGRFVEWPQRPSRGDADFTICVLGTDPFGAALDTTLADGVMHGRKAVAKRIVTPQDANACHILFISASEERRLTAIVQSLNQADILTVSDIPQFAVRGGMIQFVTTGSRVRFEINLPTARGAGLTMSSELLRVASAVRNAPPTP
jgi:hypothetical protein